MGPALPTVGIGQPLELAVELLEQAPAVVVLAGGRPRRSCSVPGTDVPRATCRAATPGAHGDGERGSRRAASRPGRSTPGSEPDPADRRGGAADLAGDDVRPAGAGASTYGCTSTAAAATRRGPRSRPRVAALEGAAHGLAFASGLAAEDAVLRQLPPGRPRGAGQRRLRRHVPADRQGARPRPGGRGRPADRGRRGLAEHRAWCGSRRPRTRRSAIVDIAAVAGVAHDRGRCSWWTTRSPRRTSSSRSRSAPTSSSTRRPSTSAATPTWSAGSWR